MRKAVLTAAAVFAVAGGAMTNTATAADMGYMPAPAPIYQPIWQGFYIGGHVGLGEADFEGGAALDYFADDPDFDNSDSFRSSLTPDGLIGGAQGGYNWQFNSLVFGVEGDVSFADWGQSAAVFEGDLSDFGVEGDGLAVASAEVDMLATVRGRLGMAFGNWLAYGTGGIAWADAQVSGRLDLDGETEWSGKENFNDMGYVAGGGLAWMVVPQTFSLGLEGLYYWFDQSETLFEENEIPVADGDLDVRATATLDDAWVVRVRGDFHF